MKSIDIKSFINRHRENRKVILWLWLGLVYILAAILLVLFIKSLTASTKSTDLLGDGQAAIIHIASGEIEGNIRKVEATKTQVADSTVEKEVETSTQINKDGLKPAPLKSLLEQSDKGMIPTIAKDGTIAWKYYARPYESKEKRPIVAIIITNLALSKPLTEEVLKLPHSFTLAFSPYVGDVKKWANKSRAEGFETMIDLPMQADDYPLSDPGQFALLEDANPNENSARMRTVLNKFSGFVGVAAPINEKLTRNLDFIRPYLLELNKRGVLFTYLKTPQNATIAELAKSRSLYVLGIDQVIDSEISRGAIESQLQSLVDLAKKQGYAIGIAHSYPPTTEALGRFSDGISTQGVDLVPVSAIAAKNFQ